MVLEVFTNKQSIYTQPVHMVTLHIVITNLHAVTLILFHGRDTLQLCRSVVVGAITNHSVSTRGCLWHVSKSQQQ